MGWFGSAELTLWATDIMAWVLGWGRLGSDMSLQDGGVGQQEQKGWSTVSFWICGTLALLFLTGTQTAFGQHNLGRKSKDFNSGQYRLNHNDPITAP